MYLHVYCKHKNKKKSYSNNYSHTCTQTHNTNTYKRASKGASDHRVDTSAHLEVTSKEDMGHHVSDWVFFCTGNISEGLVLP